MDIKGNIKNKIISTKLNKIKKMGYDDEQAKALYDAMLVYPHIIDFVDKSYNVSQINEVLAFFKHEDLSSIMYLNNLEPSKRILMIEAYNKFYSLRDNKNIGTFRLCYQIALEYDEAILRKVLEKLITDKPDYELLNLIRNAMDQNVSLYDLKAFSSLKEEKSKSK